MESRSIDLISKKTNLHVLHAFLTNQREHLSCTCSMLSCLSLPLFCTTTMPFCTTKTSIFLVTHYFYGGIVVCAYKRFFSCVNVRFQFFTVAHFHFAGSQQFSFSHGTVAMRFSCFSSKEIRLLYFQSLALSLSSLST